MRIWFALMCAAGLTAAPARWSPPWSGGRGNPAPDQGYTFQVSDVDNVPDLHGNPEGAQLVLFVGGNQFMALPDLLSAFERRHPELRGRIFYETLPPGILRRQLEHGGVLTLGNLTLRTEADVYEAGARVLTGMAAGGQVERSVAYATNQLAIMVRAGNPCGIRSLRDLGRTEVRLSMPNPAWEGVARQVSEALRKSGGDALVRRVAVDKIRDGSNALTEIHHRQTPMRLLAGQADAGVTWASEARFQQRIGNPIAAVEIPAAENVTATYAAGVLAHAPHAEAARAWVAFLTSPEAQAIYRRFGFGPAGGARP